MSATSQGDLLITHRPDPTDVLGAKRAALATLDIVLSLVKRH